MSHIIHINFKPGRYGPFFRVGKYWKPSPDDPEHGRWVGLTKPNNKEEADEFYYLKNYNPMDYVYTFFLEIPDGENDAVGFFGKVKNGSNYQIKLNNAAVKKTYIKIADETPLRSRYFIRRFYAPFVTPFKKKKK